MADVRTFTGYEPKDLAENYYLCVKPLFFHRPSITSTYDSGESIATHWIGFGWWSNSCSAGSTTILAGERSNFGPITSLSLVRENSVSSSSQVQKSTGKPVALFSRERKSSPETFSDREDSSFEHQQVQGNNEPLFRFSDPKGATRSFLDEHKDFLFVEAKSEVRKQKCRADFLDSCVRDLQTQLDSDCWEIFGTNQGCEDSRKEQAKLHEEQLSEKEYFEKLRSEVCMKQENWRERTRCVQTNSLLKWIERKSRYDTGAHFTNIGVARKNYMNDSR